MTDQYQPSSSRSSDPYRFHVWSLVLFVLSLPALIVWLYVAAPQTPDGPPAAKVVSSVVVDEAGGIDKLLASDLFTEGREQFISSCTACHGEQGQAKPNLGKDIAHSKFVAERTDDEMLAYIKVGRRVDDPLNTTGVDMPPKGGNPALNDAEIHKIIAYIRILQASARGEIQLPVNSDG